MAMNLSNLLASAALLAMGPAATDGPEATPTAEVEAATKILSARLHFTTGPHEENGNRPWTTRDLVIEGTHLTGDAPPDDAAAWYVDVTDERKVVASSEVIVK